METVLHNREKKRWVLCIHAVFCLFLLPGCGGGEGEQGQPADSTEQQQSAPPGRGWVVQASPPSGAGNVPVHLKEIRIVFDRPMDTSRWSVLAPPAGAGSLPPLVNPDENPWRTPMTCVFRLRTLQPDSVYAMQLNGYGEAGFRSADTDQPMPPALIRFRTTPAVPVLPRPPQPSPDRQAQPPATRPSTQRSTTTAPAGPARLAGRWTHHGMEEQINLDLNADGQARYSIHTSAGPETYQGPWQRGEGRLLIRSSMGGTLSFAIEELTAETLRLNIDGQQRTFRRRPAKR